MSRRQKKPYSDLAKLPEELRQTIERLLIDGATFEQVVTALDERGGDRATLSVVQQLYRSDLRLQQKRLQRQREAADNLIQALGNGPSGPRQLVQAIVLTGMMRLNERDADFDLKDALRSHHEGENFRLRQQIMQLTRKNLDMKVKVMEARLKVERVEVKQAVEKAKDPDDLRKKIDEIYGIAPSAAAVSGEVGGR